MSCSSRLALDKNFIKIMMDKKTNNLEPQILSRQIHLLFNQAFSFLVIGAVIVPLLVVYVLWGIVDRDVLLSWLAAIFILNTVRAILFRKYAKSDKSVLDARLWARYFTVLVFISGVIWGFGGFSFIQTGQPLVNAFVIMISVGIAAGNIPWQSSYAPAITTFTLLSLLPLSLRLALEQERIYLVLAISIVLYSVTVLMISRSVQRLIRESIILRFEQSELVEDLKEERDKATQASNMADAANQAKSNFLAAVSHDLRQPLHALGLFVSNLKNKAKDTIHVSTVDKIDSLLVGLESMFNGLLDISRLDAGIIKPDFRHFDIAPLIDKVFGDCQQEAQSKNINLRKRHRKLIVYSDPVLVERIIRNLMTNAVRHTQSGSVLVGVRRANKCVRVSIWDTGPGIAEGQVQKIYDEYYQLKNPERDRNKGLGLGLAIVSRLVEQLDISIELKSTLAKGSCFSINLPFGDEEKVADAPQQPTSIKTVTLDGTTILVIDDDTSILEGMQTLLESWGCQVMLAESIATALEHVTKKIPDLVIADYRLRENQTGMDAMNVINKQVGKKIPAVLVTGDTDPDRLREAQDSGLPLLHKPVRPAKLRTMIGRLNKRS